MKMYRRAAALAAALILTAGISAQADNMDCGGNTLTNVGGLEVSTDESATNKIAVEIGKNEHYTAGSDQPEAGMTVNNKGEIHTAGIWNNNGTFGVDGSGNVAMTDGTANGNFTVTGNLTVGDMNVKESIEKNTTDIANNTIGIKQNASDIAHNTENIANNTTAIEKNTADIAQNTADIKQNASDIAHNTENIANNTTAIEKETADRVAADQKLQQGIDRNSNAISSLNSRVSDLGGEIDQVGALSAALAGLHPLNYDGTGSKFQLAAAMGDYDGNQAVAFGGFYHFNKDLMLSAGGATSFEGDKKSAYNVGVSVRIGKGSSGKAAVNEDILAEIKAMNEKIAALEAENKSLTEKVTALEAENTK